MTHLIHAKLERKKKRKNASCKHVFLGAKFQKVVGLPSSHSQKLEIMPFYSHFPCCAPSLFHLFFHFILLHLEIGNCGSGIVLKKKHGSFLAVCLRNSLLPPPKKKSGRIFLRSPRGISSKKKNIYHPPHPKNQAVCSRFTFFGGGTLSLRHGGCQTTWFCEATILFCRVESSVGGISQSHRTRWEKGNAWMSRWKLDVKGYDPWVLTPIYPIYK